MWKVKFILWIILTDQIIIIGVQTQSLVTNQTKNELPIEELHFEELLVEELSYEDILSHAERNLHGPVIYSLKRHKREVADDYSLHFKRIKILEPEDNILNENVNKTNFAAHGLHFVKQGRAFVLNDYWLHFVRLGMPFFREINQPDLKEILKKNIDQFLLKENATHLIEQLDLTYAEKSVEKCTEEIKLLMQERYEKFRETNARKKRFIPVVAAGAAFFVGGALTSFFLGKNNADLEDKVHELYEAVYHQGQGIKTMADSMIGYMEISNEKFEIIDKRLGALMEATKNSFETLEQNVQDTIAKFEEKMKISFLQNLIFNLSNRLIDTFQNYASIKIEEFTYWDNVFISLRKGLLPRELFSFNKLLEMTKEIETKLVGEFEIAFPQEERSLFI